MTTPAHEMTNKELLSRFGQLVWPFRWYLLPAFLGLAMLAVTNGAIAFLVQPILDQVFINKDREMLYSLPLIVMGIFVVRGVAYLVQAYLMEAVGHKIVRGLQVNLYKHLLTMDLAYFMTSSTGALMSRMINDTNMLKAAASNVISNILREGLTVVILLGVVFYRDLKLALISTVVLPAAGYLIYKFGRRMRRLSRTRQELMEEVTAHLEETISGFRIVKAFGMESFERAKFRQVTKKVLRNFLRAAWVRSLSNPSMDLVTGLAVCGVIVYGGQSVISGATTTGTFFSFIAALMMAHTPIKRFTGLNNAMQESLAAAKRIFELMDIQPTIEDQPDAIQLPRLEQGLSFRDVVFSYQPDLPPVLHGIQLEVKAGQRIALVGRSGSGKSTLVNLVPRFFDVTAGTITLDGVDIRKASLNSLRSQIAMVTQEVILFNDTVRNNIAYGDPHRPMDEILAAARAANALEFIQNLPEGFETVIGERGVKLSGGQRQRLSIARSLLKNAPILILDEATSALDTESEMAVQEALERLMQNRTTLVIAHRLSTVRNADRIIVLREGRIVEEGSHRALLEQNGEYARLCAMQFQEEETPPEQAQAAAMGVQSA